MIALDTNVVVRLLVRDDERQFAAARQLLDDECFLGWTVIREAGWVLNAKYGWPRDEIVRAFNDLMSVTSIAVPDNDALRWALGRFTTGADFADVVHLASCDSAVEAFVSFDKQLAKQAGPDAPLTVRLIEA